MIWSADTAVKHCELQEAQKPEERAVCAGQSIETQSPGSFQLGTQDRERDKPGEMVVPGMVEANCEMEEGLNCKGQPNDRQEKQGEGIEDEGGDVGGDDGKEETDLEEEGEEEDLEDSDVEGRQTSEKGKD